MKKNLMWMVEMIRKNIARIRVKKGLKKCHEIFGGATVMVWTSISSKIKSDILK